MKHTKNVLTGWDNSLAHIMPNSNSLHKTTPLVLYLPKIQPLPKIVLSYLHTQESIPIASVCILARALCDVLLYTGTSVATLK